MKCERCGIEADNLHDYCAQCSMNLCELCMHEGRCTETADRKHVPANQGEDTVGAGALDDRPCPPGFVCVHEVKCPGAV